METASLCLVTAFPEGTSVSSAVNHRALSLEIWLLVITQNWGCWLQLYLVKAGRSFRPSGWPPMQGLDCSGTCARSELMWKEAKRGGVAPMSTLGVWQPRPAPVAGGDGRIRVSVGWGLWLGLCHCQAVTTVQKSGQEEAGERCTEVWLAPRGAVMLTRMCLFLHFL